MFSQRRQRGGGAASHDKVAAKAPYKGATGCGQGQLAREVGIACGGNSPQGRRLQARPAAACPQGAYKGLPPAANPDASRGGGTSRRGGHPLAGWLSTGKGNRYLRKGKDGGGSADGARGVRASF
ncbi:hypothetical protein GW17_00031439 [Ensete ventricosum]|nr:hypothetical protein GW17_00031439 [Ensete ventricosum]